MKNKNFLQSVICAARGMKSGFMSERNFRIYLGIALTFFVFNLLLSAGIYDYVILIALTMFAFAAEYVNTAIEMICDRICSEKDSGIGMIKDIAAAGVLAAGFAFFIGEGLVLIPKLL